MDDVTNSQSGAVRPVRADAQRNLDALLEAAKAVFATSGVDAPVREIAEQAGVGVATVYRHFPTRAQLIAAVFRREIDACVDLATALAADHGPADALALWMQRFALFMSTKRGLSAALHSGDAAYEGLQQHFTGRLMPALDMLLGRAVAAGEICGGTEAYELLDAVARLGVRGADDKQGVRMVALLVDGLRYGAMATPR